MADRYVYGQEYLSRIKPYVGEGYTLELNQAYRECNVFAVEPFCTDNSSGWLYAAWYAMPKGRIFFRLGNTVTAIDKSIPIGKLPDWAWAGLMLVRHDPILGSEKLRELIANTPSRGDGRWLH